MSEDKKTAKKTPIVKDDILQKITAQLLSGLTSLKEQLGDKKYEKRIKKAAKLLVEGIKKTSAKKPAVSTEKVAQKEEKAIKSKTATKVTTRKSTAKIPVAKKAETAIKSKTKK
jgi:hypothetical protein